MCRWNPCESIAGKIDEVERFVDAVKINSLRTALRTAGNCQPFLPGKGVNQARLSDIASTQECYFGQSVQRETGWTSGTDYKFGFQELGRGKRARPPQCARVSSAAG